ncbi:MAG: hypothetical protein IH881_00635 [Myxococcales bacterium]|nr:hypothetical protein [Myxococcales bacterium]MCH7866173.1 hypothetical protein [Myxococcales bacterium]
MSVSFSKAVLIGCGLVVSLVAVCTADESPTILVKPVSDAREQPSNSVSSLEARTAGEESPAAVAAAPETSKLPSPTTLGSRTNFLKVSRDEPIEIVSDELEVVAVGDARKFTFTNHVHVVQGDMQLFAGHLEAIYPAGASQPERLDARRNVRLLEGDLEVRCNEVTYLREDGLVICRGDALLLQGCDEVRGEQIEFYLDQERVKVLGAASVLLRFERDVESDCAARSNG